MYYYKARITPDRGARPWRLLQVTSRLEEEDDDFSTKDQLGCVGCGVLFWALLTLILFDTPSHFWRFVSALASFEFGAIVYVSITAALLGFTCLVVRDLIRKR
ncbi:MAG: hypothetical protein ACK4K7_11080 [Allosphingosinicella sp.]|uniref:hypothetical protein n=1 Tax=Allosphingosinicella sp. TaxID=2823234 RepID=UPI0039306E0B